MLTVLDKLNRLIAPPTILIRRVTVAVDIGRSGAPDRPWLAEESATQWDVVHARTDLLVPPRNDDASAQRVLVRIAYTFEQRRGDMHRRRSAARLSVSPVQLEKKEKDTRRKERGSRAWHARKLLQRHVYDVRDGLRICRRAGSTAVDAVVDVGQLVCHTIGLFRVYERVSSRFSVSVWYTRRNARCSSLSSFGCLRQL